MSEQDAMRVSDAIRDLHAAYDRAAAAIGGMPARRAFTESTRLRDALEELRQRSARELRGGAVQRIREEEGLTLSGVAAQIGLSKPRVEQLIRDARRKG